MDVREKLVELIGSTEYGNGSLVGKNFQKGFIEKIATHLIANGVTVQEWVSVKDRLPDLIPHSAGIAYSETVIVLTSERNETIAVWDGITWIAQFDFCELWGEKITHWIPIPHPPKGE